VRCNQKSIGLRVIWSDRLRHDVSPATPAFHCQSCWHLSNFVHLILAVHIKISLKVENLIKRSVILLSVDHYKGHRANHQVQLVKYHWDKWKTTDALIHSFATRHIVYASDIKDMPFFIWTNCFLFSRLFATYIYDRSADEIVSWTNRRTEIFHRKSHYRCQVDFTLGDKCQLCPNFSWTESSSMLVKSTAV